MKLDAASAIVPAEKIREYLLSTTHPIGRYKSAYFTALGYAQVGWEALERDLRALLELEAQPLAETEYGQKYAIRGRLTGPNGRSAGVISVWIILTGETAARFVTAYPQE
jgi:hypothetical protein